MSLIGRGLSKIKKASKTALEGAVQSRDRMNRSMDMFFGKDAMRGSMVNTDRVRQSLDHKFDRSKLDILGEKKDEKDRRIF